MQNNMGSSLLEVLLSLFVFSMIILLILASSLGSLRLTQQALLLSQKYLIIHEK